MTLTTQPTPADAAAESPTPEDVAYRRKFCNWLAYWRDCAAPPCRRAHSCAGDPTACLLGHWAQYPEAAQVWVHAGLCALEDGLSGRAAAMVADAALLRHVKVAAKLPLHHRAWRRGRA